MNVRNFHHAFLDAEIDSAQMHHRGTMGRAALASLGEIDEDDGNCSDRQSSSGREPRRIARAGCRVGAERRIYRPGR